MNNFMELNFEEMNEINGGQGHTYHSHGYKPKRNRVDWKATGSFVGKVVVIAAGAATGGLAGAGAAAIGVIYSSAY